MPHLKPLLTASLGLLALGVSATADAKPQGPGQEAIEQHRKGTPSLPTIQNRFFVKKGRIEIAPLFGYVPNNPFAKRFVGAIGVSYFFNEQIAVQAFVSYSPDLGESDLKGLTITLVEISHEGSGTEGDFQQPLDKVTLHFSAVAAWTPFYGKINLIGETVVNFDWYLIGGVGMNAKTDYFAKYDTEATDEDKNAVMLEKRQNSVVVGPVLGTGFNFYVSQTVCIKLDARFNLYIDDKPQYDENVDVTEKRLYSNFVAGAGVGFFFPKMKKRYYTY